MQWSVDINFSDLCKNIGFFWKSYQHVSVPESLPLRLSLDGKILYTPYDALSSNKPLAL